MPGAAAGGRLIGHAGHPLDEIRREEPVERHQHQADRAVAADVVLEARVDASVDHVAIDGIEHDHRVVVHALRARGVDPVAGPAAFTQGAEHLFGVVAALAGDDRVVAGEGREIVGVHERRRGAVDVGTGLADLAGRVERRRQTREVALGAHALEEHGSDHSPPPDDSDVFDAHGRHSVAEAGT